MAEERPRQRKFAPRSRQGCMTCRVRRKRCDEQRPACQNCTRLNLTCEWKSQRKIVNGKDEEPAEELQLIRAPGSPPPISSLDIWDALPGEPMAERKHLLRYYIEAYLPSISVATTASCFYTSLYIPMAFESEGMLDAILTMSSAQLARRSTDPDRAKHLMELSSAHEAKSQAFLRERISPSGEATSDAYQVIGITLLFVGLEALKGTKGTKWLSQLQCARKLLNSLHQDENMMLSWELDSLRRHFTHHDVTASLMAGVSKDDLSATDLEDSPFLALANNTTIDPLMGISYYLCSLICRIQYVTSTKPAFPHLAKAAFDTIERDIQAWIYDSPLYNPAIDLPIALDLIALAEAYRLAALIQLYRTSDEHKHLITSCANRAMQFVSRIPAGSPAESSLLYPMFLAGAELESEAEITKCFQRLTSIQQRNKYENVGIVREVLQEVWRPALNGGQKRDWEAVIKELGWSFTLG